jgi:hypothetical protein
MADLLFTPKLTARDAPDLSAEARMASIALHAVIAIMVAGMAEEKGNDAKDSYAIAFAAMAPHIMAILGPTSNCAAAELIATASRLGLETVPELRGMVVIQ